jgi:hypothetical protein
VANDELKVFVIYSSDFSKCEHCKKLKNSLALIADKFQEKLKFM